LIGGLEAAVTGLKAISETWAEQPRLMTPITISVVPVERQGTLKQIREWLERSPKESMIRTRLNELMLDFKRS